AIVELCVHSLRIGAQDALLDCPTREKGAYLGDATISGHAHMLVSADLAYARKSLDDYAQTAFICPGLMSVAPCSFMQEIADYSLQSPAQLLRFFMHSGDMECLSAHVTTLENLMRYFQRFARADGLLADVTEKWNLVDWPANLRDGYDFPLTDPPQKGIHAVLNAFWLAAIRDTNAILALLGKPPFADEASCREAFQRTFYSPELRLFVDAPGSQHASLHSNALALYADAAPAEALPRIIDLIREKRFACGVYMAYFVLKGLARGGAHDLVYDLILDDGEHSWRNMLREGATTLFEAWGKDQKWNTSLCHPWASAPIPVLIEDILGVTPAEPGWRAIRFAPRIPQRLKEVSLKFTTVCGEILVTHDSRGTNIRAPGGVRVLRE
ncbi:MAG TPA: alpha-L-rhamnosidase C-terminal domain-containing protein, partial [Planctomycetota bacterium]|nr:alpha-L-rhamnosidase C-terminal domain-containing protein [Planctomycetota bacterium]